MSRLARSIPLLAITVVGSHCRSLAPTPLAKGPPSPVEKPAPTPPRRARTERHDRGARATEGPTQPQSARSSASLSKRRSASVEEPALAPSQVVRCGSPDAPLISLTFDDGPGTRFTPKILAVLRRHGMKATFFVLGRLARRHPELLRAIAADGHLIANHSWDHPRKGSYEEWHWQIARTESAIRAAGVTPAPYFRPPHGRTTVQLKRACRELGYTIVLYTILSSDWQPTDAASLVREVTRVARNGSIIALHDAGGDRSSTVTALAEIIPRLKRAGFSMVGIDGLLESGAFPLPRGSCVKKR